MISPRTTNARRESAANYRAALFGFLTLVGTIAVLIQYAR